MTAFLDYVQCHCYQPPKLSIEAELRRLREVNKTMLEGFWKGRTYTAANARLAMQRLVHTTGQNMAGESCRQTQPIFDMETNSQNSG